MSTRRGIDRTVHWSLASIGVTLLFGLAGVWAVYALTREPSYEGIPLSAWLVKYDMGDSQALTAIRGIGTNALPTLNKMLHAKDSWFCRGVYTIAARLRLGVPLVSAAQRQTLALAGIEALGPLAASEVPALMDLLPDSNVAYAASWATAATGSNGVRCLVAVSLTNRYSRVRCAAISGLGRAQAERKTALATLAGLTKDQDLAVRAAAARAIGRLREDPDLSVQLLMAATSDTNRVVRSAAIGALGQIGGRATEAVPVVSRATNDDDPLIRSAAEVALRQIVQGSNN